MNYQGYEDLKWLKENLGVTIYSIATLFGVTRKTIYSWLQGERVIPFEKRLKITFVKKLMESIPTRDERRAVMMLADMRLKNDSIIDIVRRTTELTQIPNDLKVAKGLLARKVQAHVKRVNRPSAITNRSFAWEFPHC